eukprot:TRINITY_DN950_c0_g1_i1.p1 TRINITY_DN950_c0_g1~~TRINITY_DN950_c0_g1_i1.p1  ORF type:complete len:123 (-),score=17.71 TRINITY_DN950_c0_g1_i1:115-483(-)
MCRTAEDKTNGISCFMIPYAQHKDSVSFGENEIKMGWSGSPTAAVYFDNVRIHKRYMIGEENKGFKNAMMALDGGRLNIAACSLGAAHRCLEDAIMYVLQPRQTFGIKTCPSFRIYNLRSQI